MSDHTKPGPHNHDGPIHEAFNLTYARYFCVPRLALQEMPHEWQRQFVALVEKLPDTPVYDCRLKDKRGRFKRDPWGDYRRGTVEQAIAEDRA